ncbi:restriction endonuclease subunit S [Staphylococcus simulans]
MSKQNQHKPNVPELRFPEFSGEWEEKKVKEEFKVVSGSTPLRSKREYFDDNGIPWIKTMDLNNSEINAVSERISKMALNELNLKVLPKNTILIAMYGGFNQIGRTGLLTFESTINQAISALLDIKQKHNSYFFQYYFNHNVNKWRRYAASSRKDPNITKKDIESFKIVFPSYNEQKRIGDFFSKLDRQIELEEKKLALLEEQKKGYMQKIFSQELRFKDEYGNEYPEWEEKRLGEIAKITRGLTYKPSDVRCNGVRVLRSSNIINNKFYMHHDDVFVDDKIVKIPFVNNGDILITAANGSPRLVGKHALINKLSNNSVAGGFMYTLKAENTKFIQTWMYTTEYQRIITKVQGGNGSIGNLSKKDLETGLITVPSTEEQVKIGSFFEKIDGIILKNLQKTQRMQDMKKSLLQQIYL